MICNGTQVVTVPVVLDVNIPARMRENTPIILYGEADMKVSVYMPSFYFSRYACVTHIKCDT